MYRLRVEQDLCAESPLDWDNSAIIVTRCPIYDRIDHMGIDKNDNADYLLDAYETADYYGQNPIEAAMKRARRNGIEATRFSWQGYSQGDWLEGIYIGEAAGLEAWKSWAQGDVSTVILERLVTWTAEDGRTKDSWEVEDVLSGCYLSDSYTANDVAREHFGIKEELQVTE